MSPLVESTEMLPQLNQLSGEQVDAAWAEETVIQEQVRKTA